MTTYTTQPGAYDSDVQLAGDGSGKRIRNLAVQMYIDPGDGTGPALQTVYIQVVAAQQVDEANAPLTREDLVNDNWKRQMLDEIRAIRLGMERMCENRKDFVDNDKTLLGDSQEFRNSLEAGMLEESATGPNDAGIA